MKRTFIAIKIPLSKQTIELIHDIKSVLKDEKIKWVDYRNIHITLFFIGDTEESLIDEIGLQLAHAFKNCNSFKLKCQGVGVFKNMHTPKVLWFGIQKTEVLSTIKKKADEIMRTFGFTIEDRDFNPHITIGRIRYLNNKNLLKTIIEKYRELEIQDFTIHDVIYYESKLTPRGPIYKVIKSIPLH